MRIYLLGKDDNPQGKKYYFPVDFDVDPSNPPDEGIEDTCRIPISAFLQVGTLRLEMKAADGTPVEIVPIDSGAKMPDGRKIYTLEALEKRS